MRPELQEITTETTVRNSVDKEPQVSNKNSFEELSSSDTGGHPIVDGYQTEDVEHETPTIMEEDEKM